MDEKTKMLPIYNEYVHASVEWSIWETSALICSIDPKCNMETYMSDIMDGIKIDASISKSHIILNIYNILRKWGCWDGNKCANKFFIINQLLINKMSVPEILLELIFHKAKKMKVDYSLLPMIKIESDKRGI